jgi:hypothetical protein
MAEAATARGHEFYPVALPCGAPPLFRGLCEPRLTLTETGKTVLTNTEELIWSVSFRLTRWSVGLIGYVLNLAAKPFPMRLAAGSERQLLAKLPPLTADPLSSQQRSQFMPSAHTAEWRVLAMNLPLNPSGGNSR